MFLSRIHHLCWGIPWLYKGQKVCPEACSWACMLKWVFMECCLRVSARQASKFPNYMINKSYAWILYGSFFKNWGNSKTKFPSNLNCNGKSRQNESQCTNTLFTSYFILLHSWLLLMHFILQIIIEDLHSHLYRASDIMRIIHFRYVTNLESLYQYVSKLYIASICE